MRKLFRADGTEITANAGKYSNVIIVQGKNKGKQVNVSEIIQPDAENPRGMVIVDRAQGSWRNYYPQVIGAEWGEDQPALAAETVPEKVERAAVELIQEEHLTVLPDNADLSLPPAKFLDRDDREATA